MLFKIIVGLFFLITPCLSFAADTDCDDDADGFMDADCGGSDVGTLADWPIGDTVFTDLDAGDNYTSFGGINDDTINELFAVIDSAIDGKQATLGSGDVTVAMLAGPAKWVRQTITTDADPYAITPTAGWDAYKTFYLIVTAHTADVNLTLSETGPPVNGTEVVIENVASDTLYISDINSQQEIPNNDTLTVAQDEHVTFVYDTDRWRLKSAAVGTLNFATITTVETEFIPVGYMINGASAPDALATLTSGTDKVNARTFAGDADEDLVFDWQVPLDLDTTSGIKFRVICLISAATGPSGETWQFELAGFSMGDGDALDGTLGTEQTSNSGTRTDAQYDRVSTAWSSAMTSTHITNLAVGETAQFKLYRDVDDTDTYGQNVAVIGIEFKYKRFHNATF